jgi:hypothetical protein
MTKRTRKQNADEIATGAIVFVRKARRNGCVNTVTRDLFYDIAEERGISSEDYSIRTVKQVARESLTLMGETELIEF